MTESEKNKIIASFMGWDYEPHANKFVRYVNGDKNTRSLYFTDSISALFLVLAKLASYEGYKWASEVSCWKAGREWRCYLSHEYKDPVFTVADTPASAIRDAVVQVINDKA